MCAIIYWCVLVQSRANFTRIHLYTIHWDWSFIADIFRFLRIRLTGFTRFLCRILWIVATASERLYSRCNSLCNHLAPKLHESRNLRISRSSFSPTLVLGELCGRLLWRWSPSIPCLITLPALPQRGSGDTTSTTNKTSISWFFIETLPFQPLLYFSVHNSSLYWDDVYESHIKAEIK